jgi:hypothetical protein
MSQFMGKMDFLLQKDKISQIGKYVKVGLSVTIVRENGHFIRMGVMGRIVTATWGGKTMRTNATIWVRQNYRETKFYTLHFILFVGDRRNVTADVSKCH